MRHLRFLGPVFLVLFLSCGEKAADYEAESQAPSRMAPAAFDKTSEAPPVPNEASDSSVPALPANRKLIRTLNMDLVVLDPETASRKIDDLAASLGGYISTLDAERGVEAMYIRMTLRVPAEQFGTAVDALRKLAARADRENLETEDVTDQFVDLEARLKTLKTTENELQELLGDSREQRRKVVEIMAIYRELTEIRSRIEQIQGRLNALDRLVSFSTINLTLRPEESTIPVVKERWRPRNTVRNSVRALAGVLQFLIDVLIFVIIVLVPLAVIVRILIAIVMRLYRRFGRKKKSEATGS